MFNPSLRWNYARVKETAKELGVKVTDLLALAPKNDPFYVGTETDIQQAEWFLEIWKHTNRRYLRGIHYWTQSHEAYAMPNGEIYQNTQRCWEYLCEASKKARYLGLVPIDQLEDHKTPEPTIHTYYGWGEPRCEVYQHDSADPDLTVYGIEVDNAQPYHLEVWIEKSTMNNGLLPICRRYHANFATFEGEASLTACYKLYRRIVAAKSKPTRIFYISDFDPAGNSMPVAMSRKIEFNIRTFAPNLDVKVKQVALTSEQVEQYQLPRSPIKETERRAAKFEYNFGFGAVELDALDTLHPGVLENMVETELQAYYRQDIEDEVEQQKEALRQAVKDQIDQITTRYQEHIDALDAMRSEIEGIEIDASAYQVPRAEPFLFEPDGWLFDSQRDYTDQIAYYKAHKGLISTL